MNIKTYAWANKRDYTKSRRTKTEVIPQSQPVKPAENTPVAPKVDTNELENIEAQYLSKLRSQIEKIRFILILRKG